VTASSPVQTPPAPRERLDAPRWLAFGESRLDPRTNGLNLVRLLLAALVLVAHGWYLSGRGAGPHIDGENLGGWAVYGFFALSGYLITGSRWTKSLGDFLVLRVARIMPAFLVNLAVTAVVLAPIAYWWFHRTLDGFTRPTTPLQYVLGNATLRMQSFDVAGTPAGVPYAEVWNGSLWTLYYEFLCYLIIAALGSIALVRRSALTLVALLVLCVATYAGWSRGIEPFFQANVDVLLLLKLLPFFLAGGILYLVRDRIPLTWPLAVLAAGTVVLSTSLLDGWGAQLSALPVAYLVLWVGSWLPSPALVRRHDISYGVYIYAFPVQQLLAMAGAATWNLAVYDIVALAATIPLATASWLLVERPTMRRARRSVAGGHVTTTPPERSPVPAAGTEAHDR
jgi:peptidoglycan/LPS O-acetylase OafA/YrhL